MRFQINNTEDDQIKKLESQIINDVFRIRIAAKNNRSVEEIEMFGTYVSGISFIDENAGNEMITAYISIERMLIYFERGSDFWIYSKDDIKRIYDIIQSYLKLWQVKIERSLHNENPPLDKLIKYDNFAKTIYNYAKYEVNNKQAISSKFMSTLNSSIFTTHTDLRRTNFGEEEKKEELPERQNLDTYFKARKIPKKPSYR